MAKITEGYMPFHGYQTYYRIVGEQKDNGKAPLICLHADLDLHTTIMKFWITLQTMMIV